MFLHIGSLLNERLNNTYSGSKIFSYAASDPPLCNKFRTECWLEKSLHSSLVYPPSTHITFAPIGVQCPVVGAERVKISFSGLDEAEGIFMKRFVKGLGEFFVRLDLS